MTSQTNTLIHRIILIVLIIFSAGIIFYKFPSLPQNLSVDEVEFARLAYSLKDKPYTPYSPLATGHTTSYFYLILASFNTFGITPFALRLPAAFFGVLSVGALYLLFREVFNKKFLEEETKSNFLTKHDYILPALTTFIFMTTRWFFNFARFGFEATFLLFFEIVSLWFLFRFINTRKYIYLIGSGIFAGGAYISYLAGRIFFFLPIITLFSRYRLGKDFKEHLIIPLAAFFIPFIIVISPLMIYQMMHKDIRINQLSYVTNDKMQIDEKIEFGIESLRKTALMFHFEGDMNGRHNYPGKPALNPLMGMFFVIGLLYSIKKIKIFPHAFFIILFVLGMLPMTLTYPWEIPNMLRSFTSIISIIFFVGNAILLLYLLPLQKKYITIALMIIFLISAIYDLRTYFIFMAQYVFPGAFIETPESFFEYFIRLK